ncbi:hypothetical protein [Vagococcus humatus]|nr:hypothetical protein [Vagococcus humatus]
MLMTKIIESSRFVYNHMLNA